MTAREEAVGRRAPGAVRAGAPGESAEATRFHFGRTAILLDWGFWTLFAVLISLNRLLGPRRPATAGHEVRETVYWFLDSYLWAAATPLVFWVTWRFVTGGRNRVRGVLLVLAAGLVLALAKNAVGDLLWERALGLPRFGPPRLSLFDILARPWVLIVSPRFLNDLVTFGGIVAAGFAWEYFRRYRVRESEAARLHAQLAEARLAVLRTRLNPHFLFNTLNAVSALVATDPKGVRRMIARLSELLRYTLEGSGEQEIPLGEELKLTRRYLEILEIRYQGRLQTSVEADPEIEGALVPNLILQPLAENAMTHGVGRAGGHGRIEVSARRDGDDLVLAVRDTGAGDGAAAATEAPPEGIGQGVGLRSTRARLQELYGARQRLELRPDSAGGTIAEIVLPFHTSAESGVLRAAPTGGHRP